MGTRMPLGTARSLDFLRETVDTVGSLGRVEARFSSVQALFREDLAYVEAELRSAASDGARPATLAADHLVRGGGKRIRPLTVLLSAACFGPPPGAARELAVVAELVHSATLLHDDVIDDSAQRRGAPAARTLWGNAISVLAGDLLLTHALERTLAADPRALGELITTLRRLVDGEIVQLRGRAKLDTSETVYFRILEDKTASLFRLSARTSAIVSVRIDAERDPLGLFREGVWLVFHFGDHCVDFTGDP